MDRPLIRDQITFIYTTDLAAAATFYGDILGLEQVLDQGGCRIYRVAGNAFLGVCRRDPQMLQAPDPVRRGVIVTLVTDAVDDWYEFLSECDVVCDAPPRHSAEYGIYHLFLRDPSGYLIEIQCFDDPDWMRGAAQRSGPA